MKVRADSPAPHTVPGTQHRCSKFWPSHWMTEGVLSMPWNPGKARILGGDPRWVTN